MFIEQKILSDRSVVCIYISIVGALLILPVVIVLMFKPGVCMFTKVGSSNCLYVIVLSSFRGLFCSYVHVYYSVYEVGLLLSG